MGYVGGRWAWVAGATAAVVLGGACSSPPVLQGQGGHCFQVSDCQLGLVCVPQSDGSSICSSDTSNLVMTEDAGSAATTPPPATRTDGMDSGGAAPVAPGGDDASE